MSPKRRSAGSWWWAIAAPALVVGLLLGGCGGGGGLPSSLPSSIPSSFTGSLSGGFSGTRTTTGGGAGGSATTTETTTTTPATTSFTVTAASSSTTTPSSGDDTPWGWIALLAILVALLVAAIAWAVGRRGAPGREWRAAAFQTAADGTALHDAALAELIAATTANRPERWAAVATHADRVVASLQGLAASPPDEDARQAAQAGLEAAGFVRSGLAVASASPAGRPLDPDAEGTLRQRLDGLAAALGRLRTAAGHG
ncbi:MAG TPA: hypothetical protein VHI30_10595 [Gaiellales bacterium]|jgi:hypothetical protein|nr:hypothetical protein [Gaiellales bacterium]